MLLRVQGLDEEISISYSHGPPLGGNFNERSVSLRITRQVTPYSSVRREERSAVALLEESEV